MGYLDFIWGADGNTLESVGSKVPAGGEQLIYRRRFDGRQEQQSYYEVLQKLTHLLDLHYVAERRSYCKFDKRGDVEDVIRFVDIPREGGSAGGTIVTIVREILDEYLTLTEAAIVRVLDNTRYEPTQFRGWRNARSEVFVEDGDLYYRRAVEANYASYARGFQIVRSNLSKQDLRGRMQGEHAEEKRYASFIAQDWKNNVVTETSCDPKFLANYFTKSDLPFEITPAFFRPDVLLKYKKHPDKYLLEDRSSCCAGLAIGEDQMAQASGIEQQQSADQQHRQRRSGERHAARRANQFDFAAPNLARRPENQPNRVRVKTNFVRFKLIWVVQSA